MKERLQKLLSAAGLCSRRSAERYISEGRVAVNGQTAQLGWQADPEEDEIIVDGVPLGGRKEKLYLMLNKPRGYVTTVSDEQGRRTVMELVGDAGGRVYPVGRLDMDSEGLLLFTNDGDLTYRMLHPSHEVKKRYHVRVRGRTEGAAEKLRRIREVGGEPIRAAEVEILWEEPEAAEYAVTIHEGRNRQIRRMCGICGLRVERLRRVREHTLELGDLPAGKWRFLSDAELSALKREL